MKVSLWNLANRIKKDQEILENESENREFLENKIEENKALIVQCVMNNAREYNRYLDNIYIE